MRDLSREERAALKAQLDLTAELVMMVFVSGCAKSDPFWTEWGSSFLGGFESGHSEVSSFMPECAILYRRARNQLGLSDAQSAIRVAVMEAATHLLTVELGFAKDAKIPGHIAGGSKLNSFARDLLVNWQGSGD